MSAEERAGVFLDGFGTLGWVCGRIGCDVPLEDSNNLTPEEIDLQEAGNLCSDCVCSISTVTMRARGSRGHL